VPPIRTSVAVYVFVVDVGQVIDILWVVFNLNSSGCGWITATSAGRLEPGLADDETTAARRSRVDARVVYAAARGRLPGSRGVHTLFCGQISGGQF
jgi:hypothetical protein